MKNNLNQLIQAHLKGYCLIPLRGGDIDSPDYKKPLIPWEKYQTQRSTVAEIKEWAKKTDVFGIVTGPISNLFVQDDDFSSFEIQSSFSIKTVRGRHYYFRWADALNKKTTTKAAIKEKTDVRGEGGYVVAWNLDKLPYTSALPYVPQWLINLLPDKVDTTGAKSGTSTKQEDWLAEALNNLKEGNRNDTFTRICGRLRNDGYTESSMYGLLLPKAREVNFSESELEAICKSVGRYSPKLSKLGSGNDAESIETFLEDVEAVEWIAEKILSKQSICFIAGMEETNKTWLCMDLALAIATGSNWLGKFPTKPKRVLYIDQEQYKGETQRRISSLMAAKGLDKDDLHNLKIKPDSTIRLDLTNSYEAFRKLLEDVQPEVIIIDSFKTFHTKDINSNLDMQKILELVKELRTQYGCAFVFVYHENKGAFSRKIENKEVTTQYMAGAKVLSEVPELIFIVDKNSDGTSMVYHVKNRLGTKLAPFLMKVIDTQQGVKVEAY